MLINNQSIILNVHNKESLIPRVLSSIKKYTSGNYELIIVLDGCTDNSKFLVENFKQNNKHIKIVVIETPNVFETRANNTGLKLATGELVIIMQDDMIVNENDWNKRLNRPFILFDDVFAVTANCAHNWEFNDKSQHIHTNVNNDYEWSDILNHIDHANRHTITRDIFGIRQCVNRGPLMINHSDLKKLNYFDEIFAPLDMDDHDLCFRMQEEIGKVVGCYLIDFISDPSWGGTRQTGRPAPWHLKANQKNTRIVVERHSDKIQKKIFANRKC